MYSIASLYMLHVSLFMVSRGMKLQGTLSLAEKQGIEHDKLFDDSSIPANTPSGLQGTRLQETETGTRASLLRVDEGSE